MNRLPAIVGVGNTLMGDDGVGPAAIAELRRRGVGRRAELIDAGLAFGEVLCDLEPSQPLIVIDAVRGGGRGGTVYQLSLDALAGEAGSPISLHEVNVLPALRMEALAGRCFADVTVFGVEPAELSWGEGLSDCMADAMEELIRAVVGLLDQRCRTGQLHGATPARRSED